jgi:hypothetical protein
MDRCDLVCGRVRNQEQSADLPAIRPDSATVEELMAKKKQTAKRTRPKSRRTTQRKNGKFHGVIEVEPPKEGEVLHDEARVLVAIRSIEFGNIPDPGTNELSLAVAVETDKKKTGQTSGIRDLVIFSGQVHRHLTLRCSVDELDEASIEPTKKLITSGLGLAKGVAGEGPGQALLGGLPGLFGALLSFNKDDQVLVMNHSFYTASVKGPADDRLLRSGVYTFRKRRDASAKPQVEIQVELLTVA